MKERLLVGGSEDAATGFSPDVRSAWKILSVLGLALAAVGAVDLIMLIYPARLDSLDWEFATISGLVDGLPLTTLGFGLMLASAVARGARFGRLALLITMLVMALLITVALLLFLLDVPAVLRAAQPQLKPTMQKAVLKTGLMGTLYLLLYSTLGIWAWRLKRRT